MAAHNIPPITPATSIIGNTSGDVDSWNKSAMPPPKNRAHRELALGADVPDVGAIAGRESDGNQHQRRGLEQKFTDAIQRGHRLHEERVESEPRILAHAVNRMKPTTSVAAAASSGRQQAGQAGRLGARFEFKHRMR